VDEYSWLREKDNPEVIQHLEAENAYTKAVLQPTEAFQEQLYQEMLSVIQQTDLSVPYQLRGYLYFTKTEEGKQYPLHFRQGKDQNNAEERLLDLNALAEGYSFWDLVCSKSAMTIGCLPIRPIPPVSASTTPRLRTCNQRTLALFVPSA